MANPNPKHLAKLKEGVDAWNQWRKENPEITPNLRKANLSEANLREANLSGATLREADLRKADLREANLDGANLQCAKLGYAKLGCANLHGANLQYANLRGTKLHGANLQYVKLLGANLDFCSGFSYQCSSFDKKTDVRLKRQEIYHLLRDNCNDPEWLELRELLIDFGNKFHRADECGLIEKKNQ